MQLHRAREQFDAAGVGLVLIGQAKPRDAAEFRSRLKLELPILADERRVSYKALGARRATAGELIGPKMVAKGLMTAVRTGVFQGKTVGSTTQLGGAAVVLPDGEFAFRQIAQDASDNATPEALLAAVR